MKLWIPVILFVTLVKCEPSTDQDVTPTDTDLAKEMQELWNKNDPLTEILGQDGDVQDEDSDSEEPENEGQMMWRRRRRRRRRRRWTRVRTRRFRRKVRRSLRRVHRKIRRAARRVGRKLKRFGKRLIKPLVKLLTCKKAIASLAHAPFYYLFRRKCRRYGHVSSGRSSRYAVPYTPSYGTSGNKIARAVEKIMNSGLWREVCQSGCLYYKANVFHLDRMFHGNRVRANVHDLCIRMNVVPRIRVTAVKARSRTSGSLSIAISFPVIRTSTGYSDPHIIVSAHGEANHKMCCFSKRLCSHRLHDACLRLSFFISSMYGSISYSMDRNLNLAIKLTNLQASIGCYSKFRLQFGYLNGFSIAVKTLSRMFRRKIRKKICKKITSTIRERLAKMKNKALTNLKLGSAIRKLGHGWVRIGSALWQHTSYNFDKEFNLPNPHKICAVMSKIDRALSQPMSFYDYDYYDS